MDVQLITPPTVEPVSLEEAKTHIRLEESVDDAYIEGLIVAARQHIEGVCWRGLLKQTWKRTMSGFDGYNVLENGPSWLGRETLRRPYIDLPRGHLNETPGVIVEYLDENGNTQTLDGSKYLIDSSEFRNGRLHPVDAWPSTLVRFDAVRITYNVGWTAAENVPAPLRHAVLLLIGQMYEYRTPEITGTIATEMKFTIDALTQQYRLANLV